MAELRDILGSGVTLQWMRPGVRLAPTPSADVPERVIFLNNDGVKHVLCFKDGDGVVQELRTKPV